MSVETVCTYACCVTDVTANYRVYHNTESQSKTTCDGAQQGVEAHKIKPSRTAHTPSNNKPVPAYLALSRALSDHHNVNHSL